MPRSRDQRSGASSPSNERQLSLDFGTIPRGISEPAEPPRPTTAPKRAAETTSATPYQEPTLRPFVLRAAERLDLDPETVDVRWGRGPRDPMGWITRRTRLASIRPESRRLRVHPLLNDVIVPAYALEFLVYHELCHIVAQPFRTRQGWSIHHEQFRALEHAHPYQREADAWFRRHIAPKLQARRIAERLTPDQTAAALDRRLHAWMALDLTLAWDALEENGTLQRGR